MNDTKHQKNSASYILLYIFSGGLAGCCTTFFVYPLDFARTRLGVDMGKSLKEREFTGLFSCISKVYKANGIRGVIRNSLHFLFLIDI